MRPPDVAGVLEPRQTRVEAASLYQGSALNARHDLLMLLTGIPTAQELHVQVTPQQSLALVEYIAHLSVQDWTAVTGDLQRLGSAHNPTLHALTEHQWTDGTGLTPW